MAIEDYRGVAFGDPELGWGYNMTEVQFFGLIARALARPTTNDSTGKPILGQVIVGNQLKPGDPSYADVLNGGNDMQEYPDMATLKQLATQFLTEQHPDLVQATKEAFASVVPADELDWRAQSDIFHFIGQQLYDNQGRQAALTGAAADRAVTRGDRDARRAAHGLGELRGVHPRARLHEGERPGAEVDRLLGDI